MSRVYGARPQKKTFASGGLTSVPAGAQLLTAEARKGYETIPFHVYYPGPHDIITVLHSKKSPHEWLVCGWYLGILREGGQVKGLVYRQVASDADKEAIMPSLKRQDKEASPRFAV